MTEPFPSEEAPPSGEPSPAPYLPDARFSLPDVVWVLLAGVVGAVVVGGIIVAIRGSAEIGVVELSVTLAGQSVASLLVIDYLSKSKGTGDWALDFGLQFQLKDIPGIGIGLVVQVVAALLIAPFIELFGPENPPQQEVATVAQNADGGFDRLFFMFLIVIVAPFVEEIVFRGMLLSRLRRSMGKWSAILLSAAVFAVIHLLDPNAVWAVPGLFLIGIVLAWFALRGGNLSMPIFVHIGVNLTGALLLIFGGDLLESLEGVAGFFIR